MEDYHTGIALEISIYGMQLYIVDKPITLGNAIVLPRKLWLIFYRKQIGISIESRLEFPYIVD